MKKDYETDYFEDNDEYYDDYEDSMRKEDTFCRPARVYISDDMRVTMNDIDIDNLSIYQLENLLGILKHASQEAGKRIIARRLRRMATLSRGNKRVAIERMRERDMYD